MPSDEPKQTPADADTGAKPDEAVKPVDGKAQEDAGTVREKSGGYD